MAGRLDEAVESYKRSIDIWPTAEAHTFLGWAYSFQGRYDAAIRECEIAIQVDPDFGNPYNDIGAYLIELGRLDEAIEWFQKATRSRRYEPRHYPHFNLSRVYVRQGKIYEAIRELQAALGLEPEYTPARRELHRLVGMLN
jgi:tetratricopeptide (TPR) repeat protein